MESSGELFGELAMNLHDEVTVIGTAEAVLQFAVEALHYSHASILLTTRGKLHTVAATGALVTSADQLQLDTGEGPSLAAITSHESVLVTDTLTETRWPKWAPTAAENGIRSVLSIRLHTSTSSSGALNLVSAAPRVFVDGDSETAHLLALHASIAIANSQHETSLARAVDSHKDVGQAVGTLMERHHIDAIRAFAVLKRYSQDNNIKLRDIAHHLNTTGRLPTN